MRTCLCRHAECRCHNAVVLAFGRAAYVQAGLHAGRDFQFEGTVEYRLGNEHGCCSVIILLKHVSLVIKLFRFT